MELLTTEQLRKGNYVQDLSGNEEIVVAIISNDAIRTNKKYYRTISSVYPIPLTGKLLNKFNLVPVIDDYKGILRYRYYREDFRVIFNTHDQCAELIFEGNHLKYAYYMHELQNMFYEKTDFDLTIKEPEV